MKRIFCSCLTALFAATSLFAAPQAIVFDFGGVLTGKSNRECVVDFIKASFHLSKEEFEKLHQEKQLACKAGKTDAEFWLSYAKASHIDLPADWTSRLHAVMKEAIGVNEQMYLLVEELRGQKMQVALFSNIDERLAKLIREFGLYEPFQPCLLSCELGVEKPDPKGYELLLAHLNLPAHKVVFIDDKEENVEAAKKGGLDAILFQSEAQVRRELVQRGVVLKG